MSKIRPGGGNRSAQSFTNSTVDNPVRQSSVKEKSHVLENNSQASNFTAETTKGTINFHECIGDGWAILFSHPKHFTPVCTTELGDMAGLKPEFDKTLGLSVDPVGYHSRWAKDIDEVLRLLDSM
jgi:alkyl hydroperoxide reductase subunit AhpC